MSSSAIPYPRMARIKDAAAQFGCSVHYLRNLCRSGKVRYTAVSSRRWLVNLDSLARFFEPVSYTHLDVYKRQTRKRP